MASRQLTRLGDDVIPLLNDEGFKKLYLDDVTPFDIENFLGLIDESYLQNSSIERSKRLYHQFRILIDVIEIDDVVRLPFVQRSLVLLRCVGRFTGTFLRGRFHCFAFLRLLAANRLSHRQYDKDRGAAEDGSKAVALKMLDSREFCCGGDV